MSHGTVLVMAENEDQAKNLLKPYDETLEVTEYRTSCVCVGEGAKRMARAYADEKIGRDIEEDRAAFNERHPANKLFGSQLSDAERKEIDEAWDKEIYLPRAGLETEFLSTCDLRNKPDPECETCHGSGIEMSTYNPQAKWDYYQPLDNRWDLRYAWRLATKPEDIDIQRNVNITRAIVTPMYGWQERGRLGWFGIVFREKEEDAWQVMYWNAYNEAVQRGLKAFVYDYHI